MVNMKLSIKEILFDLHSSERELQDYEKKYNMRSEYFYELFKEGLIEDEGNFDFQAWAGIYEIKLDRERQYKKHIFPDKVTAKDGNFYYIPPEWKQ